MDTKILKNIYIPVDLKKNRASFLGRSLREILQGNLEDLTHPQGALM
jgi:hypothetical protein